MDIGLCFMELGRWRVLGSRNCPCAKAVAAEADAPVSKGWAAKATTSEVDEAETPPAPASKIRKPCGKRGGPARTTEVNDENTDEGAPAGEINARGAPAPGARGKKATAAEDEEKMEVDELEGDDNKDASATSRRKPARRAKPASKSTKAAKPSSSSVKGAK
ncbi:hypothetical protein FRC10_001387 [Ceratobasidium sp. 414]|nr:hypothetical protein FRC10_001387 [Ceratobasidium sp. 414]